MPLDCIVKETVFLLDTVVGNEKTNVFQNELADGMVKSSSQTDLPLQKRASSQSRLFFRATVPLKNSIDWRFLCAG